MDATLQGMVVSALGFVGVASVGLVPARSWSLMKHLFAGRPVSLRAGTMATLGVLLVAAGLSADVIVTLRVFRCLTTSYCGPNVGSGWIYLSMLGAVYLAFEFIALVLRRMSIRATIAYGLGFSWRLLLANHHPEPPAGPLVTHDRRRGSSMAVEELDNVGREALGVLGDGLPDPKRRADWPRVETVRDVVGLLGRCRDEPVTVALAP